MSDKPLAKIRLLLLDVDGVLTTGDLPYLDSGIELKAFHVQDGSAIKLWKQSGGSVGIVSGRDTPAVMKRAKDLGIDAVYLGVADKLPAYEAVLTQCAVNDDSVCVVGDDWMDLGPMRRCGFPVAVANALPIVKRAARYVTRRSGGSGAIAEVVERLLRLNGKWTDVIGMYL